MLDITPILEAVLTLMTAIITAVIVPYIQSKTTYTQQAKMAALVQIAVTAAEQIYSDNNEKKKAYALTWLKNQGLTVDSSKLDTMIESAVYELKSNLNA